MSFGKPPLSTSTRRPPTSPLATKKPPLIRSSTLCRPTAASAAKNSHAKNSSASSIIIGSRPRISSTDVAAEAERLEAEELYSLYLQSELMRLTALDNCEETKEAENKESTMMWTAVSLQRNRVTDKEIREDDLNFLRDFASQRTSEIETLAKGLEKLPETAANLQRLATALERTQDFLQVAGGIDVHVGDVDRLREVFRAKRTEFHALLEKLVGDQSQELGFTLKQLRRDMDETIKCYDACHLLLTKLKEDSVREESLRLNLDLEERKATEIDLEIPPPVLTPILVDI